MPLLGDGSVNMPVVDQWLSSRHVTDAIDMHAKTEELLEAVFSVQFVPRLYNEDQLSLPVNPVWWRGRILPL
jgi:hypothetical protein